MGSVITRTLAAVSCVALTALACTQVLGLEDPKGLPPLQLADGAVVLDLPDTTVTACSRDLSTDPANCGRCGHACGGADGGVCAAGQCAPERLNVLPVTSFVVSRESIVLTSGGDLYLQLGDASAPAQLTRGMSIATFGLNQGGVDYWYTAPGTHQWYLAKMPYGNVGAADASISEAGLQANVQVLYKPPVYVQPTPIVVDDVSVLFLGYGLQSLSTDGGSPVNLPYYNSKTVLLGDASLYVQDNAVPATTYSAPRSCDPKDGGCPQTVIQQGPPSACGLRVVSGKLRYCTLESIALTQRFALNLYEVGLDGAGYRLVTSRSLISTDFNGNPVVPGLLLVDDGVIIALDGRIRFLPDDGTDPVILLDLLETSIRAIGTEGKYVYFATPLGLYRMTR